jgi:serine/threonine protein kinase
VEEARALAKFSGDSGVVGVRAFFFENGTAYIVMDFVEGETLKTYAERAGGKLPAAEVLRLFRPLLTSIDRVHQAGLLHRDISPDNIILKSNGSLALLDFGAARQMSLGGEHSNTINVKHGFAPEEQYRTRGEQGPWTDVYATSATIYRLITGHMPPQALDRLFNEGDLILPSVEGIELSEREEKALVHGLAIRAADRTKTMREFADELYGENAADASNENFLQAEEHSGDTSSFSENVAPVAPVVRQYETNVPEGEGDLESIPQSEEKETDRSQRKRREIVFLAAGSLAAIILLAVFYIHHLILQSKIQTISERLDRGDYISALAVADSVDWKTNKFDSAIYGFTSNLLAEGEFEAAESMKGNIGDTSAFDMISVEDDITYQKIQDLIVRGEFTQAELLVVQIRNHTVYNTDDIKEQISTQKIEDLISDKKYLDAVNEIVKLQSLDAIVARDVVQEYADPLYEYGITLFQSDISTAAKSVFSLMGQYDRASDYLLLIDTSAKAKIDNLYWDYSNSGSETNKQIERLIEIADFENAGEILMSNSSTAFQFMQGEWHGGPAYIKFYFKSDSRWATSEITGIPSGQWDFLNGDFYITDSQDVEKKIARFTVIDRDSIEIFVYSSERTYSLKRT